jgi:hypothetical protein
LDNPISHSFVYTVSTSTRVTACQKNKRESHMSQTMKSTNTSAVAIPAIPAINAINAQDSTVNVVGRDLTNITNVYNVDPNCDQGIWTHHFCDIKLTIIGPDKIYQWLSAIIPSMNYHGALKARLENTGLWFINGARFARWKGAADDFLWICGTRMCSYHLRVIVILNYYCSWHRKDRLEVNLGMIALRPLLSLLMNNGSAVHRSSKTWLIIARQIRLVLLLTFFSMEGMVKKTCNKSIVSFAPSLSNSPLHMEVFLPRWPNFTNPAMAVDLSPRCNPFNPSFLLFSNHSMTFISFSTLLTNAPRGRIF